MKRALEDSDSDDFDEVSKTNSPSQSCHSMDRKKRRGVIEKRRRDRINTSLSELKRLVPTAFEKQGSAKLEKAEILQMTVEHLKMLQARGLNNPAGLECDYRGMGFRECVAEVARYLATIEGLDLQNPVRVRLLSHLEAYGAQKEVALKAELSGYSTWPRITPYGPQGGFYPAQNADILSSKLKDSPPACYAGTYPVVPTYLPQTVPTGGSPAIPQSTVPFHNTSGPSLANFAPDNLYSGNYSALNTDYKFRPW